MLAMGGIVPVSTDEIPPIVDADQQSWRAMPLDPGIRSMLDMLESMNVPQICEGTPEAARTSFRMLTTGLKRAAPEIEVESVTSLAIPGPTGDIPARVYRPRAAGQLPTVLFCHGGGFVIGDLDTHDNQARRLCRDVQAVVVSIDYRLAPEDPWPAGIDDALAALRWVAANLDEFGQDPTRLAVAGDSAGGNFAAVIAQVCRDEGSPQLAAQLLIYPGVDFASGLDEYASRIEYAEGYFLTTADMAWFAHHYIGDDADPEDPRLSPLRGTLTGLPPAVVATAEFDPLRDEGEAYAAALRSAGVAVVALRFDGLIHGFFDLAAVSPACAAAADSACAEFAKLLRPTDRG